MTRAPVSTYRLQLSGDFPLEAAAAITDYLHELGVDWVYCSPILQATSGSSHGYDVVDPARVDEDRGGTAGLAALAEAAHDRGLGVLVDIVPNHMGVRVPAENAWWWDVLRHGSASRWARHFDIDWAAAEGRLRIPVLAEPDAAAAAEAGMLRQEQGELVYRGTRYPLSDDTDAFAGVVAVHEAQHYELVHWERADAELNYRRFFAVNDLAGVRVEDPEVFHDTHAEIARWFTKGLVDGLRVDHPDGLADPGDYLKRLAELTGGAYVLVEKILEHAELLPPFWRADGTTGYDALADLDRVLVDPGGRPALERLDSRLRGGPRPWAELVHETKRGIADGILQSEVRRIVRDARAVMTRARDAGPEADAAMADAVAELLACFPVYRSYLPYGAEHLEAAIEDASRRRPELTAVIVAVGNVLRDPATAASRRFQQTSGMVMAKGVEDTAFYRTSRLASLTEVGGDPSEFAIEPDEFHLRQQVRLAAGPHSMTTLSTHDTKRGEDTRARITALSEVAGAWAGFIGRRRAVRSLDDGPFENLLWESIVGAWPREREALHGYAEKAAREAGTSTSWARPDADFEARMHELIDSLYDEAETAADVRDMVARIERAGWSNGLALKLLQLTGPGVPDVYQGSELWERSLVDPDNRRSVDFDGRRRLLARLDAGWLPPVDGAGAAKLLVTSRALRARRDRPECFGRYAPLPVLGAAAAHAIAVDRGGAVVVATRLPIGLETRGGWGGTTLIAPPGPLRDALTGDMFTGGEIPLAELLARYPVSLLLPEAS